MMMMATNVVASKGSPGQMGEEEVTPPVCSLFHVNSVDLTRRRHNKDCFHGENVDWEDEGCSGLVRFSDTPVEVIRVTLPFEVDQDQGGERASKENDEFIRLPVKRGAEEAHGSYQENENNREEGETNPSKRPKLSLV